MPHIHTEPGEHDHTVSSYIVRIDGAEPRILLHRHKKFGKFLQFGGHIELDENPWQALLHETVEESGYDIAQLKLLQPKIRLTKASGLTVHPLPVISMTHAFGEHHNHSDWGYLFTTDQSPNNKPDKGESTELRLFTVDELDQLTEAEIFPNTVDMCKFLMSSTGPLVEYEQVDPKVYLDLDSGSG